MMVLMNFSISKVGTLKCALSIRADLTSSTSISNAPIYRCKNRTFIASTLWCPYFSARGFRPSRPALEKNLSPSFSVLRQVLFARLVVPL